MSLKNILSWGAFGLGYVLIICGWLLFGDRSDTSIFILNIVVSIVMYSVVFSDLLIAWNNPEDKSQRRIGNTGLRWGVTLLYVVIAFVLIVLSNVFAWTFAVQLFAHSIAIVVLIAGYALVAHSANNIGNVTNQQSIVRSGVDMMRREAKSLHYDMLDKGDIPAELSQRVAQLVEDMRFISPANSEDARILEQRFVEIVSRARVMVSSFTLNHEELAMELSKAERTLKDRKATYSN
ncbi:MAG: hypothetical protein IKW47_02500 [Alistipes sp.]|nr:hypothetical protein [Alistipes sp.]